MTYGVCNVFDDPMCAGFGCTNFMVAKNEGKIMCDYCAKLFPKDQFPTMWEISKVAY